MFLFIFEKMMWIQNRGTWSSVNFGEHRNFISISTHETFRILWNKCALADVRDLVFKEKNVCLKKDIQIQAA